MTIGAAIKYLAMKDNIDGTLVRRVVVASFDKQVKLGPRRYPKLT